MKCHYLFPAIGCLAALSGLGASTCPRVSWVRDGGTGCGICGACLHTQPQAAKAFQTLSQEQQCQLLSSPLQWARYS